MNPAKRAGLARRLADLAAQAQLRAAREPNPARRAKHLVLEAFLRALVSLRQ